MKLAIKMLNDNFEVPPYLQRHERAAVEAARATSGVTLVKPSEQPDHVLFLNLGPWNGTHALLQQWVSAFASGSGSLYLPGRVPFNVSTTATTHPKLSNVPYLIDKWQQNQMAANAGVNVPQTILVNFGTTYDEIVAALGDPFFFYKPRYGFGGLDISLVRNSTEFVARDNFIAQKVIGNIGTDYQAALVETTALSLIKRTSPVKSPKATDGARVTIHHVDPLGVSPPNRLGMTLLDAENVDPIPAAVTSMLQTLGATFDVEIAGVDLLLGNNGTWYFNEINFDTSFLAHMNVAGTNPYATYLQAVEARFP